MTDDAVREEHGVVTGAGKRATAYEDAGGSITIDLHGHATLAIAPEKAAYLGSKLRRLARRAIARRDAE
jgi:hypothetical protein